MTIPPYLKEGDKVGIISSSNFTKKAYVDGLIKILKAWKLVPVPGKTIGAREGSFAGSDTLRKKDFQEMLDKEDIKAVFQTMGGYGISRIIEQLDFNKFKFRPKWLVGYSDTTFLHAHIQGNLGIASLHATMAADLSEEYHEAAWESLRMALFGEKLAYSTEAHPCNRIGKSEAILVGGTVSILCNAKGTFSDVNTNGKILFLEEVGEHYYRLDSYMTSLKQAGKFAYVKGLIVGHLQDMKKDEPSYGKSAEEIIRDAIKEYDFPVCFGFPAGHAAHNLALPFGTRLCLQVDAQGAKIAFPDYLQEQDALTYNGAVWAK